MKLSLNRHNSSCVRNVARVIHYNKPAWCFVRDIWMSRNVRLLECIVHQLIINYEIRVRYEEGIGFTFSLHYVRETSDKNSNFCRIVKRPCLRHQVGNFAFFISAEKFDVLALQLSRSKSQSFVRCVSWPVLFIVAFLTACCGILVLVAAAEQVGVIYSWRIHFPVRLTAVVRSLCRNFGHVTTAIRLAWNIAPRRTE